MISYQLEPLLFYLTEGETDKQIKNVIQFMSIISTIGDAIM